MNRRFPSIAAGAVLVLALAAMAQAGLILLRKQHENAVLAALAAGRDIALPRNPSPRLLAARGRFLLAQGRAAAAQDIADKLAEAGDAASRGALLTDIGNAMMRRALPIYYTKPMRQVAPLIRVAKLEYRQALQLDPQNWTARFNLDVADALVRETESPLPKAGSTMAEDRATIPDAPGVPNGMP